MLDNFYFLQIFWKVFYSMRYLAFCFKPSTKFRLSHAIPVGNLPRRNSLRIRKSTLYFVLTCLKRAHVLTHTRHARRSAIHPVQHLPILFLTLLPNLLYPCNSVSHSVQFPIAYIFLLTYISEKHFFCILLNNNLASYFINIFDMLYKYNLLYILIKS